MTKLKEPIRCPICSYYSCAGIDCIGCAGNNNSLKCVTYLHADGDKLCLCGVHDIKVALVKQQVDNVLLEQENYWLRQQLEKLRYYDTMTKNRIY